MYSYIKIWFEHLFCKKKFYDDVHNNYTSLYLSDMSVDDSKINELIKWMCV